MHGLPIVSAFLVRQAGAGDEAASGLIGMIESREKTPI
jgi:hypothetical protein